MRFLDEIDWIDEDNWPYYRLYTTRHSCPECRQELKSGRGKVVFCPACGWKREAVNSLESLKPYAWVLLQDATDRMDQGEYDGALTRLKKAEKTLKELLKLLEKEEDRLDYMEVQVFVDQLINAIYVEREDEAKALTQTKRSITKLKKLLQSRPRSILHCLLSIDYSNASWYCLQLNQLPQAQKYAHEGVYQAEMALEKTKLSKRAYENNLISCLYEAIELYHTEDLRQETEVESYYEQLLSLLEKRKEEDPEKLKPFEEKIEQLQQNYQALQEREDQRFEQMFLDSLPDKPGETKEQKLDRILELIGIDPEQIAALKTGKISAQQAFFHLNENPEGQRELKDFQQSSLSKSSFEQIQEELHALLAKAESLLDQNKEREAAKTIQACLEKLEERAFSDLKKKDASGKAKELAIQIQFEAANLYLDLREGKKARKLFETIIKKAWPGEQSEMSLYYGGAASYTLAFFYFKEKDRARERKYLKKTLEFFERVFKQSKNKNPKLEEYLEGELPYIYYRLFQGDIDFIDLP